MNNTEFYDIEELKEMTKKGLHILIDNYNKGIVYSPLDNFAFHIIDKQIKKYKKLRKMKNDRIRKKSSFRN